MPNLSGLVKITKVKDPTTADASSIVESDVLDMAGYEGVVFFTSYGTAASDNSIKLKGSTANSTGTMGDITGSSVAVASSDEDVWLDVYRPRYRYLQLAAVRGTSSKLGDIWAVQYGGRKLPESNSTAGTIKGETNISQSTGTA